MVLPYCWYDTRREKIALQALSSPDAVSVDLIYGDPYQYEKEPGGTNWVWRHQEKELSPQYRSPEQTLWRVELDVPVWRRLKYGFRVKTSAETYYVSESGTLPYHPNLLDHIANFFLIPYIHKVDAPAVPDWVGNTVWYQIFPERFCRGDPRLSPLGCLDWETGEPGHQTFFGGDLPGIRQKLPYLADLGINGLYLTPIFTSPSNHKYNIEDYFAIDPHFGTLEDLKNLVSEAHRLGIRVMLDAVFNHAGSTHPFWRDVLNRQEHSQYKEYFHIRRFPVREDGPQDFETFSFTPRMPKWNTENPGARKYLLEAARYWIRECDIDGWRLDVANEVSLDFWREFAERVRREKPDFYILGEMWFDGSPWIKPGYFDAVMHYPLGYAIGDYFLKKQISAQTFSDRLVTLLSRYSGVHSPAAFTLLDSHDTQRALTAAKGDKQALRNAFGMLFLLPGSPCLYYGTEIGLDGAGDPHCRKPMRWDPAKQDRSLFAFFKELIAFRRKYSELLNRSAILYAPIDGLPAWDIADPEGRKLFSIVYPEGAGTKMPKILPEDPILRTGDPGDRALTVYKFF
jgi:glycosidase